MRPFEMIFFGGEDASYLTIILSFFQSMLWPGAMYNWPDKISEEENYLRKFQFYCPLNGISLHVFSQMGQMVWMHKILIDSQFHSRSNMNLKLSQ